MGEVGDALVRSVQYQTPVRETTDADSPIDSNALNQLVLQPPLNVPPPSVSYQLVASEGLKTASWAQLW